MRKLWALIIVLAFAFAPGCASHRHHHGHYHHDAGDAILVGAAVGALVGLGIWAASQDGHRHHHGHHRHHHRSSWHVSGGGYYCDY